MGASPRYVAEHLILPRFIAQSGPLEVLAALERNDADFFIPVWMEAGFRFTPRFFVKSSGPFRVGALTFPMPREQTEGWLGVIVARSDAPPWFRYFVWEKSVEIMTGADATVIAEWRGDTHVNHGKGPAFTGQLPDDVWTFADAAVRLCGTPS
jgi:hypothetical protein